MGRSSSLRGVNCSPGKRTSSGSTSSLMKASIQSSFSWNSGSVSKSHTMSSPSRYGAGMATRDPSTAFPPLHAADDRPLVEQAAARSTSRLVAARAAEADALLQAGMAVMVRNGTTRRATVAEIVRESGLSNQAFYRHFESKDDLVAAIIDAGARRLTSYLEHQMASAADPLDQVRAWITGVLSQATDPAVAGPTRAVAWNRGSIAVEADGAARQADGRSFQLLVAPLRALGRPDPERDAYLIGTLAYRV